MGVKRHELNEAQWSRIAPLLPDKSSDPGRTEVDNRTFVNGCLWILRSGVTASGRRSTAGLVAGARPAYGSKSLMPSVLTGTICT
ncbi:transposase [Rhizobium leguminosarum]|nr:transposase [Rhizobium leguminosarum]MBY5657994.1 transposase [Rhizobium leguminosarum]MBY5669119.1 transposase [Rhizobium leguminosarum]MBY5686048.1 transposase [Rhizobium leguminosarum]MBY5762758.1 transposase [Rhizobium leguminosarum]